MAKLTEEIKALVEKGLAVVATASKDGTPNAGPKGSVHLLDDETLVYAESTARKTLANLKENPRVSVMLVDKGTFRGYQLKGRAELVAGGELFDRVAKRQEMRKRGLPKEVVKIKVEEIYTV